MSGHAHDDARHVLIATGDGNASIMVLGAGHSLDTIGITREFAGRTAFLAMSNSQ